MKSLAVSTTLGLILGLVGLAIVQPLTSAGAVLLVVLCMALTALAGMISTRLFRPAPRPAAKADAK